MRTQSPCSSKEVSFSSSGGEALHHSLAESMAQNCWEELRFHGKNVSLSPNMEIEKWVVMIPKDQKWVDEDVKPATVQIGMKIQESAQGSIKTRKNDRKWDECGCCRDGHV
ncbi:Uncharacterized protein Adt_24361 [Abeliophyllum distichum]|uniref:Uncharacterized protein n=1 Tax=Abeliophyllum distichum TaxID=126358 RepID=A0ABD1SE86_9LAMI